MRTYSLMNEDEDEDDRNRRLAEEARSKQVRVMVERLASPAKPDASAPRASDRRKTEEEQKAFAENAKRMEESRAALPECPYCDKTFTLKWNLIKHLK